MKSSVVENYKRSRCYLPHAIVLGKEGAEGWDLVGETVAGALGGGIVGGLLGYAGGAIFSSATGILGWSITQYSVLTVKAVTILGPMPLYIEVAKSVNAGYYLISDPLWEQLSDTAKWYNNSQVHIRCL